MLFWWQWLNVPIFWDTNFIMGVSYKKHTWGKKLQGSVCRITTKPSDVHPAGTKGHSLSVLITNNYLWGSLQNFILN